MTSSTAPNSPLPVSGDLLLGYGKTRTPRLHADQILRGVAACAASAILVTAALLILVLTFAAAPALHRFGLSFVTHTQWRPNEIERPMRTPEGNVIMADGEMVMEKVPPEFGALPVIFGTTVSSVLALLVAVPLSFGAAIFLTRIAPKWMVVPVSFLIEFLAAIPSIAFGIWGLFIFCPILREYIERPLNSLFLHTPGLSWLGTSGALTGRDMFAGGMLLAIMIVPIITAISRDILRAVPRAQIEGTVALGATWWQSSSEMLKYSRAGLFSAVMLGLARAAGETMAVTMVIGNNNQIASSIFAPAQTMSSLLANEFAEAGDPLHRSALSAVALILLIMSLGFNIVARYLIVGKKARVSA